MEKFDELNRLNQEHKTLLNSYIKLFEDISTSDLVNENKRLHKEIEEKTKNLNKLEKKIASLNKDNQELKNTLLEQIIDERLQLVKISYKKLSIYFEDKNNKNTDRLTWFENDLKAKLTSLEKRVDLALKLDKAELLNDIEELKNKLTKKVSAQREQLLSEQEELFARFDKGMEEFREEEVDGETLKKRIRRNRMEMKIGLGWFNKIGIVLIVISIALAAYYNREHINDYVKGIAFFVIGFAFVAVGEFFYRKEKNQFAQGLIGGGVAILFTSVFVSCFVLEIVTQNMALVLSVLISFLTIVMSLRYKSPTIISLGLIGGYLPFITYIKVVGFSGVDYYYGMGYLLVLNLITLFISFKMKWFVVNYLSFILFLPGLLYLVFNCPSVEAGIVYSSLAFLLYTAVVLVNPVLKGKDIHIPDVILFTINTVVGSLVVFLLFEKADLSRFEGVLSLCFCIVFYFIGNILDRYVKKGNVLSIISFVTALTFAILIIPFEFGSRWLSIGWLVEGTLLIVYGVSKTIKYMERAGWLLFALCLVTFFFFDVPLNVIDHNDFFPLKFFFITSGLVLTYITYHFKLVKAYSMQFRNNTGMFTVLNLVTVITLFSFLNYIIIKGANEFIYDKHDLPSKYILFFNLFVYSVVAFSLGKLLLHKKLLTPVNKGISLVLNILANLLFLYMLVNNSMIPSHAEKHFAVLGYLAFSVLIVYNVIIVINLRQTIIRFFKYNYLGLEWLPLTIAIFLLLNITFLLVIQFNFSRINLILSLIYLVYAIGCIVYGFYKRYSYIRYFGLGLTFFTLGKLFIWDLRGLDESGKIIAYFCYGLLLIGISFVYQRINKMNPVKKDERDGEK